MDSGKRPRCDIMMFFLYCPFPKHCADSAGVLEWASNPLLLSTPILANRKGGMVIVSKLGYHRSALPSACQTERWRACHLLVSRISGVDLPNIGYNRSGAATEQPSCAALVPTVRGCSWQCRGVLVTRPGITPVKAPSASAVAAGMPRPPSGGIATIVASRAFLVRLRVLPALHN